MRRNLIAIVIASVIVSLTVVLVQDVESAAPAACPVLSVREFELRSGVKPEEFENYARQELTRALEPSEDRRAFSNFEGRPGRPERRVFVDLGV